MRFLLYNIRYGAGTGYRFHFPFPCSGYIKPTNGNFTDISRFIGRMEPDIVGLVEVDTGSFRSERRNQAQDIARRINHRHVSGTKYATGSLPGRLPVLNKQGNALLTNQEIVEHRFHYLKNGVKRLVIELELDSIHLFLVHLSLQYRHRQDQLAELAGIVSRRTKPMVVAGDFNVFRGDTELARFQSETGLQSANGGGIFSHPSRAPRRQLDYILFSPELRSTGFSAPRVTFSDHIPLIWDFEIP